MNFTRLDIVDTKAFAVKKSRRLRGTGQERGAKRCLSKISCTLSLKRMMILTIGRTLPVRGAFSGK